MSRRPPISGSQRRRWALPLLFGCALVITRVLFLLAAMDPAEERAMDVLDPAGLDWSRGPERPLFDREELYAGTAAEAIREGLRVPIGSYRFMPYGSGSLAVVVAAVPLYRLFGSNYLVFKILPLLVTIIGGLSWLLVVRRWLGERAAFLFGILYIFAPPVLVRTALIAKGDHPEAMAWIGLVMLAATHAAGATERGPQRAWAAVSGLLFGLGVWITYSTIPIAAGVAAVALLISRGRPRAAWLSAAAGILVGLIPWILVVTGTRGSALQVYGRPLGVLVSPAEALARGGALVTRGLWASYDLPGGLPVRSVAAWLWLAAVLVGWVVLIRRVRQRSAVFIMAGTAAQILAYCLAAPDPSSRYLIPVYPLLLAAAIYPAASYPERKLAHAPIAWTGMLGIASTALVVATSSFAAVRAPLSGTFWPLFGEVLGRNLRLEQVLASPAFMRPFLCVGLGERICLTQDPTEWDGLAAAAGPDSGRVWEGIGIVWFGRGGAAAAAAKLRQLPTEDRVSLRRGIAYSARGISASIAMRNPGAIPGLLRLFDSDDRIALEKRFGRTAGILAVQAGLVPITTAELDPKALQQGLGWALYRGRGPTGEPRLWSAPPPEPGADFSEGLADAYEYDLRCQDPRWILGSALRLRLFQDLERITARMHPDRARLFYRAAGRAVGAAAGEGAGALPAVLPWNARTPASERDAFESGVREGVADFDP